MAARSMTWPHGLALRFLGVGLCVLAWRAIVHLIVTAGHGGRAGLVGYALATAGFLCASLGSALAILGEHVFDEVQVSARWRRI
ncbi:hypothetical protein KV697_03940 [Sphingomonas sanguinis]|uniref:Polysaccharide biosynthesis protein n=1 Tax=Sphingomonas sanguinis TaxID=33051 RepID=A0ABU5LNU3_9SPHN|nr:hypothetical protein [Sphingomonas sanguinis]MDZ7281598.1 hypothetical protein [Sphingomonas sanguinis]QXT36495.1 hypothetical protein KV697_03940 [Sphingomonas sanguinis]